MCDYIKKIKKKLKTLHYIIFNNPSELGKQLKIQYKKLIIVLFYYRNKNITNNGERYDPLLTVCYEDNFHLPRYDFAKQYLSFEDSVLDIACGTGYGTEILSKKCRLIHGVDISIDTINYAKNTRKGDNIQFINEDLYKNNINADIVVSFETIEHIPNKKIEETIEKLVGYANKLVIGSYPYKEKEGNNDYHFQFNLDEKNLDIFKKKFVVNIFYQDINGKIFDKKGNHEIQNLIFIINKNNV